MWIEGFFYQVSLSHTHGWVMSHTWMSHIYERVISLTCIFARSASGWKDSCAKCYWGRGISEWVMLHIWKSRVLQRIIRTRWRWMQRFSNLVEGEEYIPRESLAWNESFLPKVSVCEMTHPYAGYDSFVIAAWLVHTCHVKRGGGLGSRPKKMYGERLGDGVEYHLLSPTPRR